MATRTHYNGQSLLDGSKSASFQIGANSDQTVGFDFASLSVGSLPNISSASSIDPSSATATVKGEKLPNDLTSDQGFNFNAAVAISDFTTAQLKCFFIVDIDNSGSPVTVNLSALAANDRKYTGAELATLIENQLNQKFGDERYFDPTSGSDRSFKLSFTSSGTTTKVNIDLGTFLLLKRRA